MHSLCSLNILVTIIYDQNEINTAIFIFFLKEHVCGSLDERGVYIYMAELLCYAPETIITLLIGYTPI